MSKKKADRADRVPFGKLLAWQINNTLIIYVKLLEFTVFP